jgi:hypothetical protein
MCNKNKYSTEWSVYYKSIQSASHSCTYVDYRRAKSIILPIVLYGCKASSLIPCEEHRLGLFENGMRRRIFGPKRKEMAGDWRRLHNEERYNFNASPNQGRDGRGM